MRTDPIKEKACCPFAEGYIEKFISEYKTRGSTFNYDQLYVIVETMVNFSNAYAETFMKQGYAGDVVWIFQQLGVINDYVKEHGRDTICSEKIEKPLCDFRLFLNSYHSQSPPRLICDYAFVSSITKPHQMARGEINQLKLHRFNPTGYYFIPEQMSEFHTLIGIVLSAAIDYVKKTEHYAQTLKGQHLYYAPAALSMELATPKEKKESPVSLSMSSVMGTPNICVFNSVKSKDNVTVTALTENVDIRIRTKSAESTESLESVKQGYT